MKCSSKRGASPSGRKEGAVQSSLGGRVEGLVLDRAFYLVFDYFLLALLLQVVPYLLQVQVLVVHRHFQLEPTLVLGFSSFARIFFHSCRLFPKVLSFLDLVEVGRTLAQICGLVHFLHEIHWRIQA